MPNAKNIAQIKLIEEKFSKSKSVVLTSYSGLSVKQQTKLRSMLRKAGGEFVVAKNTLLARVLGNDELKKNLEGQTGTLFSYTDEVEALKTLVQFAKDNNLPQIKVGIIGKDVMSYDQLISLSKLPGKKELISMMLGRLNAPGTNLVSVLQASIRDLAIVLGRIAQKGSEAKV